MRRVEQAGEIRTARIESLRALAALGVLAAHVAGSATRLHGSGVLERGLAHGFVTIHVFFALTGYLLVWPFVRRAFGDGERIDLPQYAINRVLRILPLYYVALVVYLALYDDGGSLAQWLSFATLSENFSSETVGTVNPVLWTVVIEVHFYALVPLLGVLIARAGTVRRALLAVLALGLLSLALRWVSVYDNPHPQPYLRYSLPACFLFFVPGIVVALLRLEWERQRPRWLASPLAAPGAWVAVGLPLLYLGSGSRSYITVPACFLLVGACVLPLRPSRVVRALDWRPVALVGVASYSLYIWHLLVIRELISAGVTQTVPLLAAGVPLSIAAAGLSYAVVERPFLRLRRRWGPTLALRRQRAAQPAL